MSGPAIGFKDYALGDLPSELERLRLQSGRLETMTRRFLGDAGIARGMRVLELGCGLGDLTKLVAEIIGPRGEIVTVDRSSIMLANARQSLQSAKLASLQFIECDLASQIPEFDRPFDALIGRLILTHLDNPSEILRRALRHVRPQGLIAFQEADCTLSDYLMSLHREKLPLTHHVCEWIKLARGTSSLSPDMGLRLYHVFKQAGLPAPTIYFHTEVYGGACATRIRNTITIVQNLLPRLERLGISAGDIGIETLEERLTAELTSADVVQAFASIASASAVKEA